MPKVVIDGIEYVPACDSTRAQERLSEALIVEYMGEGYRGWNSAEALDNLDEKLYVSLTQATSGGRGQTLRAFCAMVVRILALP